MSEEDFEETQNISSSKVSYNIWNKTVINTILKTLKKNPYTNRKVTETLTVFKLTGSVKYSESNRKS